MISTAIQAITQNNNSLTKMGQIVNIQNNQNINICHTQVMETERTVHKQLIDQNRQFHRPSIESAAKVIGPVGREYHCVAIIGVQNSGKSTLLNHLFGTNFSVLKEMAGTRTTRGIWASVDKKQNIIVLDVEGNDSMDRAEEQDYQKMVATYALVTANVLIINVWSKSLGQYNGSQYETLKVIMDICITQFKHESPKTILFCVRDFNDEYDNEGEIRRKIVRDVQDIWRKIQKPKQLEAFNEKPQKFFTIQVSVLRRYKQGKAEKFLEDVAKLRQKFINPKTDGYVFAKQKTQFNLPIDDLPQLTQNSWNSIKSNKKLNLPNEKDQLASFRCSTIYNQIFSDFQKQVGELAEGDIITDFGKLRQKYIENYEKKTYHYGKHIAEQKRKQLTESIDDSLKKTAIDKINLKSKQLLKEFQQQSKNFAEKTQENLNDQMKRIYDIKINDLLKFMKAINYDIPNRKQRIQQLQKSLQESMKQTRESILKMSQDIFQNEASRSTRLLTSELIKNYFGFDFWVEAKKAIESKSKDLVDTYRKSYTWATGQELDPVDFGNMEEKIRNQSRQSIKSELQKSFQGKIIDYFKLKFNKDEDGNHINFNLKTEQEISKHFDKTRQQVIDLISKINQFNQTPRRSSLMEGMSEQNSLFQSTWLSNVTEQIDKQMIGQFQKAIRRKKQSQMNSVPWWMFLLILYFVYDDIWFTAEESPVIHYTLVGILLLVGIFLAIGQGKIIKQTVRMVTDKLKDRFAFLR